MGLGPAVRILRILTYDSDLGRDMEDGFRRVPPQLWRPVVPQLMSLLSTLKAVRVHRCMLMQICFESGPPG